MEIVIRRVGNGRDLVEGVDLLLAHLRALLEADLLLDAVRLQLLVVPPFGRRMLRTEESWMLRKGERIRIGLFFICGWGEEQKSQSESTV